MRKIKDLGEFGLLRELGLFGQKLPEGWIGPGDDCAIAPKSGGNLAITTDLLIEDIHFRLSTTGPRDLGWKAAAVNLSDLASMGARPLALTVGAALPKNLPFEWAEEFYKGLRECADRFDCVLAGGDTSSAEKICLSVTALGDMEGRRPLLRSGARENDDLWLSGEPGESAAGLLLLEKGLSGGKALEKCLRRHLCPEPRVELGLLLAERRLANSAIDVSDGVLADAGHISERSGLKVLVEAGKIPMSRELCACAAKSGADPLELALGGGEDYELLFTAPPKNREAILEIGKGLGLGVAMVGKVEKGSGVSLLGEDGREMEPKRSGWSHF